MITAADALVKTNEFKTGYKKDLADNIGMVQIAFDNTVTRAADRGDGSCHVIDVLYELARVHPKAGGWILEDYISEVKRLAVSGGFKYLHERHDLGKGTPVDGHDIIAWVTL